MKCNFKYLLIAISLISLQSCMSDILDVLKIIPPNTYAPMYAEINGTQHGSDWVYSSTPMADFQVTESQYHLYIYPRSIKSDDKHAAEISLEFKHPIDSLEFKFGNRYPVIGHLSYDLEESNYKVYETDDGWITINRIDRDIIYGQFEFFIKESDTP